MNSAAEVLEEKEVGTQVIEFSEFEKNLADYTEQYKDVVYDLSDEKQMKAAKSDKLAIGKTVAKLDARHKEIKEPLQEKVRLLDGERKRIKDGLRGIQESIKSQIAGHEAAAKARVDALKSRVSEIRNLAVFTQQPTIVDINGRLLELGTIDIDETFEELKAEAALALMETQKSLDVLLADLKEKTRVAAEEEAARVEAERIQKEVEEKARIEREKQIAADAKAEAERIAAEAAKKAEREAAERVEAERQATLKAEQDKADAIERERQARAKAEADKKAAAKAAEEAQARAVKEAEEKAEREAVQKELARIQAEENEAAAQAKREANKKHRTKVDETAADAIEAVCRLTSQQARFVVQEISLGNVPNVTIHY